MSTGHGMQRGFTLVSAIFLLVIMTALGVFAVTMSTTQHQTSAQDVMGARAYQAARAGIEWGAFHVLENTGGITCTAAGANNAVTMPATVAEPTNSLTPFTVNVNCRQFAAVTEGAATTTMFQLTSTATTGAAVGGRDYIERQIVVTIARQP